MYTPSMVKECPLLNRHGYDFYGSDLLTHMLRKIPLLETSRDKPLFEDVHLVLSQGVLFVFSLLH